MKHMVLSLFALGLIGTLSCSRTAPPPASGSQPLPAASAEPAEARQYVIEDLKGTALVFEEGSTQGEKASEEQVVASGDEIITKSTGEMTLTLDESTMVHVAPNSDIKVDQLMPNTSGGFLTRLKLVEGKILCEVERLQESRSSFEVSSGGVICGVRGTAFEVQKQGQSVLTNTFHGTVELKKGDLTRQVSASQHLGYSLKAGSFSTIRPLDAGEKKRYRSWSPQKDRALAKRGQRVAILRSLGNLPQEDRLQVLKEASKVKAKDRVKKMRLLLERTYIPEPGDKPLKDRQKLRQNMEKTSNEGAAQKRSNRLSYERSQKERTVPKGKGMISPSKTAGHKFKKKSANRPSPSNKPAPGAKTKGTTKAHHKKKPSESN